MSEMPAAVSIREAMVATGKSRSAIYEMLADGDLPGYRTKRAGWVIPRPWFDDWLHGRWVPGTSASKVTVIHQRKAS
ncbi:MAG: hypothetical protein WBA46_09535 [Thermomicrobiales bacterium]